MVASERLPVEQRAIYNFSNNATFLSRDFVNSREWEALYGYTVLLKVTTTYTKLSFSLTITLQCYDDFVCYYYLKRIK